MNKGFRIDSALKNDLLVFVSTNRPLGCIVERSIEVWSAVNAFTMNIDRANSEACGLFPSSLYDFRDSKFGVTANTMISNWPSFILISFVSRTNPVTVWIFYFQSLSKPAARGLCVGLTASPILKDLPSKSPIMFRAEVIQRQLESFLSFYLVCLYFCIPGFCHFGSNFIGCSD